MSESPDRSLPTALAAAVGVGVTLARLPRELPAHLARVPVDAVGRVLSAVALARDSYEELARRGAAVLGQSPYSPEETIPSNDAEPRGPLRSVPSEDFDTWNTVGDDSVALEEELSEEELGFAPVDVVEVDLAGPVPGGLAEVTEAVADSALPEEVGSAAFNGADVSNQAAARAAALLEEVAGDSEAFGAQAAAEQGAMASTAAAAGPTGAGASAGASASAGDGEAFGAPGATAHPAADAIGLPVSDPETPQEVVDPFHLSASDALEVQLDTPGALLKHDELPLPDFDHLTLAALRARMQRLDVAALIQIRDYERAHANRLPVMRMIENRITKVSAQG